MSELSGASFWPSSIFGDTLRIVFQNLLLETNEDILQCSERVWSLLVQVYEIWFCTRPKEGLFHLVSHSVSFCDGEINIFSGLYFNC